MFCIVLYCTVTFIFLTDGEVDNLQCGLADVSSEMKAVQKVMKSDDVKRAFHPTYVPIQLCHRHVSCTVTAAHNITTMKTMLCQGGHFWGGGKWNPVVKFSQNGPERRSATCLAFHHLKLPFHHLKLSLHHLAMPFRHHNKVFVICDKLEFNFPVDFWENHYNCCHQRSDFKA